MSTVMQQQMSNLQLEPESASTAIYVQLAKTRLQIAYGQREWSNLQVLHAEQQVEFETLQTNLLSCDDESVRMRNRVRIQEILSASTKTTARMQEVTSTNRELSQHLLTLCGLLKP